MLHSHFGIYAIITNSQNQILLIKKARGPYIDLLDLPGGSIEDFELLEDCLKREIKEETGCNIQDYQQLKTISSFFDYYDNKKINCRLRHIGVIYKVKINGNPRKDGDGEDSNGCVWLDIKSLESSKITPFVSWAIEFLANK